MESSVIKQNYDAVLARVHEAQQKTGRRDANVVLVAVSKTHPVEKIEALYRLGHRDFGENYVQELVEKAQELERRGCTGIRWHFIGHLQTNKVKLLMDFVFSIHSVDSFKLAQELNKRASKKTPIFIEVNIDEEDSKSGLRERDLKETVSKIGTLPNLEILGLMCIPSSVSGDNSEAFQRLRTLCDHLGPLTQGNLSMGMSHDFESAIHQGATHVRVGTLLFGERQ